MSTIYHFTEGDGVMRDIHSHKVNPVNDVIKVTAIDTPSGEPVMYEVSHPDGVRLCLNFQHGPITEVGVNGITNEVLLAVVLDRLQFFQKGKYACRENALALTNIEQGLLWLHKRTWERMMRGVEGTNVA